MTEISVVVTNFNYGRYIARCLRSLLSQEIDKRLYEIILVDDGSTDDSLTITKMFEDEVRIIRNNKNEGLSKASNIGIENARGRYIVRVDADDYVHALFVRVLLLGFELLGRDFHSISVDYHRVDEIGNFLSYGDAELNPIACGIAFKADALNVLGYYDSNLRVNEEVDLRKRFNQSGFVARHIKLPLYRYVQHDKSLTKKVFN